MKPDIQAGRLSDIIGDRKIDWSGVNERLRSLEPGERISIRCPEGITMARFRSTVLTSGRRYHRESWRLSTKTQSSTLHCFLIPTA